MSPGNLILMSLLVVLATAAWTAPVEEREEVEPTEEAEGERSEEDEDDDDSTKKAAGPPGAHQSAAGASGVGPDASSLPDVSGSREAPAAAGQSHGTSDVSADSDAADAHWSANGGKPLNGMGGDNGAAGAPTSFEGGASQPEYTGTVETHFPLGLLGEPAGTDSADEESLTESDVIKQAEGAHASDRWPSTPAAEPAHPHSSPSLFSSSQQQADGDRSHQANGNGRQTQLADKDGVTARPASLDGTSAEPRGQQLPSAPAGTRGAGPSATAPHPPLSTPAQDTTRLRMDGTESSVLARSEPPGGAFADTPLPGTQAWRTDAVTMATESLFSGSAVTSLDFSGTRASQDPGKAGSVADASRARGQGPEAADNAEPEDTC